AGSTSAATVATETAGANTARGAGAQPGGAPLSSRRGSRTSTQDRPQSREVREAPPEVARAMVALLAPPVRSSKILYRNRRKTRTDQATSCFAAERFGPAAPEAGGPPPACRSSFQAY